MKRRSLRLPSVLVWTAVCVAGTMEATSCGSRTEPLPECTRTLCPDYDGSSGDGPGPPDAPQPDVPFV